MVEIFIVGQESRLRKEIGQSLALLGMEIVVFEDGTEAYRQAKTSPPDLIFLWVELPKMGGYAICNQFKKDKERKGIPLVLLSQEVPEEEFIEHRSHRTHADGYLRGHISSEDCVAQVRSLLTELDDLIATTDDITVDLDFVDEEPGNWITDIEVEDIELEGVEVDIDDVLVDSRADSQAEVVPAKLEFGITDVDASALETPAELLGDEELLVFDVEELRIDDVENLGALERGIDEEDDVSFEVDSPDDVTEEVIALGGKPESS